MMFFLESSKDCFEIDVSEVDVIGFMNLGSGDLIEGNRDLNGC